MFERLNVRGIEERNVRVERLNVRGIELRNVRVRKVDTAVTAVIVK